MNDAAEDKNDTNGLIYAAPKSVGSILKRKPKKKKPKNMLRIKMPSDYQVEDRNLLHLLKDRGKSYGPYVENARMAQAIKKALRSDGGCFAVMQPDEQQSLDMITTKIARIVTGPNGQLDSWVDCVGYAQLIVDRMKKEQGK